MTGFVRSDSFDKFESFQFPKIDSHSLSGFPDSQCYFVISIVRVFFQKGKNNPTSFIYRQIFNIYRQIFNIYRQIFHT